MIARDDQIQAQEQVVSWTGLLSPFIAMRTLSAGLSGTDFAHHRHFADHAEIWRKLLVKKLNEDFAINAGDAGWEYKAGPDLWKKIPPFEYKAPTVGFALRENLSSILVLLGWLLAAIGLALRSAKRVRVV